MAARDCNLHKYRMLALDGAKRIIAGAPRMSESAESRNIASFSRKHENYIAQAEAEVEHVCRFHCRMP